MLLFNDTGDIMNNMVKFSKKELEKYEPFEKITVMELLYEIDLKPIINYILEQKIN